MTNKDVNALLTGIQAAMNCPEVQSSGYALGILVKLILELFDDYMENDDHAGS